MLVTSVTNAGVNNTLDPSLAATFSWTTNVAQAAYEFKWREVKTIIWNSTGKVASSTTSRTIAAGTFSKNKHIEWNVRAWDASDNVSAWYGMDVLIAEVETKQIINVGDIDLKAVSFGKSKATSKVRLKDPDLSNYELDVVSIDDYAASKIRISQDGVTVQAAAKKLTDYDATVYSDHINTGNIRDNTHVNTGYAAYTDHSNYAAYTNWANGGYSAYSDWCNYGYVAYCNWCNGGYSRYSNWTNSGYSIYNNHSNYAVYGGGYKVYSKSGYNAGYNNHSNGGYSAYSNWCNGGSCNYNNWCNGGYSKYPDWSNGGYTVYSQNTGYTAYSNHSNTGYAAYSDHSDSFSRSY